MPTNIVRGRDQNALCGFAWTTTRTNSRGTVVGSINHTCGRTPNGHTGQHVCKLCGARK